MEMSAKIAFYHEQGFSLLNAAQRPKAMRHWIGKNTVELHMYTVKIGDMLLGPYAILHIQDKSGFWHHLFCLFSSIVDYRILTTCLASVRLEGMRIFVTTALYLLLSKVGGS